jgi:hypothetical protein
MNLPFSHSLKLTLLSLACAASAMAQSIVFSNWPAPVTGGPNDPLAGNTYSYSTAANLASEMGDRVQLAGTDRYVTGGRFLLSSFNISSTAPSDVPPFPMDWVVRFYSLTTSGPISAGPLLGSATVTAMVPYRPTPFPRPLPQTGDFGAIMFEVAFDSSSSPILVTDQIIFTLGPATFTNTGPAAGVNIALQISSSETVLGVNVNNNSFWRRLNSTGNLTSTTRDTGIPASDTYAPYMELMAAPVPEPSTWALIIGGLSLCVAAWYRRDKRVA